MLKRLLGIVFAAVIAVQAHAQSASWLQIEAHPTLSAAQDAARKFSAQLDDVVGFHLGSNWYGVALGPYSEQDAENLLRQLRRTGQIPRDSFVSDGQRYGQQFWPVGVGISTTPKPLPTEPATDTTQIEPPMAPEDAEPIVAPEPTLPDETPAEARASEAQLTREQKMDLQVMLQWAGFYNAGIDGSFGRGTRNSMAAWQEANGYEATGILTTAQRADLFSQYNAILEGTELTLVEDANTGVAMQIPMGLVQFSANESPFARYVAKDDSGVQVLVISQPGDRTRLYGLYEILQTLEIMPLEGPRDRGRDSFEIEGLSDTRHSYATARHENGAIKGFVLVWPAGDEERRNRVLSEMKNSFVSIDGLLSPAAAPADSSVDMVSGLAIRTPQNSASGFFADARGTTVTAAANVDQCERVTIGRGDYPAKVAFNDGTLAVLTPETALAPLSHAVIQTQAASRDATVAVGGYPYGGALALPTVTFGTIADDADLTGDASKLRLRLTSTQGDVGGPVFDTSGAVVGVLVPTIAEDGQMLPENVGFAANAGAILSALAEAAARADQSTSNGYMAPETLTSVASDVTVLVNCW